MAPGRRQRPHPFIENRLLATLPAEAAAKLLAHFESIALQPGDILYKPGERAPYVYFPASCLVSLQYLSRSGGAVEIAAVGTDGLVGVSSLLRSPSTHHAVIEVGGTAIRMPADVLAVQVVELEALRVMFHSYLHALLSHITQNAACNAVHALTQRFSRWVLECGDRLDTSEIPATQELIARLLGVRRESINHVATALNDAGVLQNARGHMQILNRAQLESVSCECHGIIRHEYARLLDR